MKFSEVFTSKDNIQLDKKTLVILRWLALIGQYFTICSVYFILNFKLPFFLLLNSHLNWSSNKFLFTI